MSNKEDKKIVQHPRALYFCGLIYSFVNFAYYGMKLILILFLAEQIKKGGLGFSDAEAASLLATFMAWAYLSPVFGGWISDRFLGPKLSVQIGTLIVSIGYFIGYVATNRFQVYLMIILAVIGSGFYKGNLNTLVGSLYPKNDTRKDAAFSLTYTFTNIGVLLGPLICGLIANEWFATKSGGEIQVYGYKYVFLVVAIAAFLGFLVFTLGQKKFLNDIEKSENKKEELERRKELAKKPLTSEDKKRMIVILILAFFTVFFWMAYNQASMSIALYTQHHVNLNIGSFVIPTSWIDSYNGLLCVILGPIMAAIWVKLSQTKRGDLNIAQKMSLGFLFLAAGFLFIITAVNISGTSPNSTVKASVIWIILFITFQSIGEMCFSPIGYGMVDRLAPEKYSSLFMGIWFGSIFVANKLSGYIQAIIDDLGMKTVFMVIPIFLGILGILLFILNKKLEKMAE